MTRRENVLIALLLGGPGSGNYGHGGRPGEVGGSGPGGGTISCDSSSDFNSAVDGMYRDQGKDDWEADYITGLPLRGYFGNDQSFRINRYLRGDKTAGDARVKETVKNLDKGLDQHGLDVVPPSVVYRAVSGEFADQLVTMKVGDSFVDKGWTSTAGVKDVTKRFGDVRMHITMRSVKRALVYKTESEVLFPPGSKFTVEGMQRSGKSTIVRIGMD